MFLRTGRALRQGALAILFAAPLPGYTQGRLPDELKPAVERVERLITDELSKDNLGSVTVGVISGVDLIWAKSFGLSDIEKRTPAMIGSVYRIGSITKQFTALMLLQMVEAGKVHLADPVEKYLPEINGVKGRMPWAPPVTIYQLATMTSGLAKEPEDPSA